MGRPDIGFEQGFEIYQRPVSRPPPPDLHRKSPHLMLRGTDDDVIEEAATFIGTRRDERWFLYLHLMDVHQFVFDEETAVFGTTRSDLYDNSILREDKLINRLFSELSREEQLSKTLVIIASDHGEAFLERGLEGHARHVYRETTEVPLVMSFPFRLTQIEVNELTQNVDIWPTILDLLGLPPLSSSDGRSLLPEILAATSGSHPTMKSVPDAPVAVAHLDRTWGRPSEASAPAVSIVTTRFRMVYSRDEAGLETQQLYDHQLDPKELKDVSKGHPEILAQMAHDIRQYLDSPSEGWAQKSEPVALDELQLNQLRALGYSIAR